MTLTLQEIDDLRSKSDKLERLLFDAQPGLHTWQEAIKSAIDDIAKSSSMADHEAYLAGLE